ncbi:hypothetical protein PENTCL1PPCAC_10539, partial [Pristionchus entomophagus]
HCAKEDCGVPYCSEIRNSDTYFLCSTSLIRSKSTSYDLTVSEKDGNAFAAAAAALSESLENLHRNLQILNQRMNYHAESVKEAHLTMRFE